MSSVAGNRLNLRDLSPLQVRRYFESRVGARNLRGRGHKLTGRCPLHGDDRHPSLSINLEKGAWFCFAENTGGGLIDFEMRYSRCDKATAFQNLKRVMGL